jgi:DNA-binding transcriptional LysR family regulator
MSIPRTTLEQWAVLAAVVDHGSFAQAAQVLHRSQSAVSYAVARLQEALDLPLLVIEGRKAVLTAHGQTLLRRARNITRELEELELLARTLREGWEASIDLVIDAAFPRTHLLDIVCDLQRSCPGTQIQLSDAVLSGAEEAILGGTADVVVTTRVPPGFVGDWLMDVPFLAVAAAGHPLLASGATVTTAELLRHVQCVVRDSGAAHPRDDGWLGANTRCTVSSMEASLAIVEAGLAYAWLPRHLVAASLDRGTLRALPLGAGAERKVSLSLVLVRAALAGPAARMASERFLRQADAQPVSEAHPAGRTPAPPR